MSSGHTTSRALRTRRRAAVNGGVAEQATGGGALPRSRMDVRRTSRLRTPSPQVPTRPLPPAHPVSAVGRPPRGATCRDRSSRTQQADHRHQRGPVRTSAQSTTPRNVVNRGHHRAACSGAEEVVKLCAQLVGTKGAAVVATRVVHGSIIVLSAVSNAHPGRRGHGPLGLQTAAALTFTRLASAGMSGRNVKAPGSVRHPGPNYRSTRHPSAGVPMSRSSKRSTSKSSASERPPLTSP